MPASHVSVSHVFHVWADMAVQVGPAFPADRHRHFAAQLFLSLDGTFMLRSSARDAWRIHTAAIVPSHVWHEFDAPSSPVAMVYLDPLSSAMRAAQRMIGSATAIAPLPPEVAAPMAEGLRKAGDRSRSMREAIEALLLSRPGDGPGLIDGRVAHALEILGSRPQRLLSQVEMAAHVGLSADRFRHLFRQQTGVGFSAYRLWNRVVYATRLLATTADLTRAAHAAGFSDSAHFSRTFHSAFGLKPSDVFKSGRFQLVYCD